MVVAHALTNLTCSSNLPTKSAHLYFQALLLTLTNATVFGCPKRIGTATLNAKLKDLIGQEKGTVLVYNQAAFFRPDQPFDHRDDLTPAVFQTGCDRVCSQENMPWRGVVGNRLAGTPSARAVDIACPKATIRSVQSCRSMKTMRHTPATRKLDVPPVKPCGGWSGLWAAVAGLLVLVGGGLMFHNAGEPAATSLFTAVSASPASNSAPADAGEQHLPAQRIDTIQLGQRLVGRNPIRDEAELVEPDPATWRKISLYMTKESGLGLWIDLLRPLSWIDERGAMVGGSIYFEMPDMGAVGDAQVTYIGPCPPIEPGDGGAVVTGTFKHQADASNKVIHLQLEDQSELTGVTDNHPYWSVDRQQFVPAGNLHPGELVDTTYGPKRVRSITPIAHDGFLYNLETTEHVYRVGSLRTLVHNTCPIARKFDGPIHHIASNKDAIFASRFRALFDKAGVSINSPWNRMRLQGHVGPHGKFYHQLVYNRLRKAVAGQTGTRYRAALIGELKAIRHDIRYGGWDALLKAAASRVDVLGNF